MLSLDAIDDDTLKLSLSDTLMQKAEIKDRWTLVGLDTWIECGMWWLLKASPHHYHHDCADDVPRLVSKQASEP